MQSVFVVGVELSPESRPFKDEKLKGGFVNCYVPADDIRGAIDAAERALSEDEYVILFVESAILFEEDDWQHEPDIIAACKSVLDTQEVAYGEFEVFFSA